jgi:2-amino-4-hydroxy-6-hydroxymethyldihydropteridine diphosphokinase
MTGVEQSTPMSGIRCYVGIGSNLDNPVDQVRRAVTALRKMPATDRVVCSPLYRSEPLGPPGQPEYVNAVACLETGMNPRALLAALQAIERRHVRVRAERWGPRTLDLDMLLYGTWTQDNADLTLPHPRMHERAFVLYPLHDIAPELSVPGRGRLRTLLESCPPLGLERLGEDVKSVDQ